MLKKKDGFEGQRAVVLPRKILADLCLRNPMIEGMHITDIGYYPKARHHYRERLQGIDQNILIYCVEGKGSALIEQQKYQLEPGSFVIVPARSAHSYSADEKDCWTIYWIHFKGITADTIAHTTVSQLKAHMGSVAFNEKRIRLFEDIYTSLERGYGNDNLCYANMSLWHYVSSFLYPDKFIHSESRESHDAIEQAISYMQSHLSSLITLSDIAQSVNFSVSHFSSLFRKKTGFSPIEYLIHLKIQKACQYLLFTDLRVKEISERLGIEDPYYFSRMFHKLMGVSPNQYRAKRST